MAFLVLAYPEIKPSDYKLIQHYRRENDGLYYNLVEPHFTIVFPVLNQAENQFVSEVKEKASEFCAYDFVLRCATINKDAFSDYFHTFLVPDEGYSQTVRLHDLLYSGTLRESLRLDLDFIPHIGVGNSLDKQKCKKMVDEWNKKDFSIKGIVSSLTIVEYTSNRIRMIGELKLQDIKNKAQESSRPHA